MPNVSLPKKYRIKGLYLYCNKCKNYYADDTKVRCKCSSLVYRAKIHVAGTRNKSKIQNLQARTIKDAINELLIYKNTLIANSYQNQAEVKPSSKPVLLTDCMAKYLSYLSNEGVPLHKQKTRSKGHINDYVRNFKYYLDALKSADVDASILKFTDINDIHVGYLHDYLLNKRKLKNKSYNNIMSALRIFTGYIIKEFKLSYSSPFEGVKRRHVNFKVISVSKKNFYSILEVATPENGMKILSTGERKNFYKDWLVDAFWLGLFTGGRRDAVVNLRWSDISVDENKIPCSINISDYKYNRAKSDVVSDEEKKVDELIIYPEFHQHLLKLGYEEHKGSERYILAPESTMKRETMKDVISKAFAHYAQIINLDQKLEFKHLRKTFSTAAYMQFGKEANVLTGHKGMRVVEDHYLDRSVLQKKAREEFKIFE